MATPIISLGDLGTARQSTVNAIRKLKNDDLRSLMGHFNIKRTGLKAELQQRLIDFLDDAVNRQQLATFTQIRQCVLDKQFPSNHHAAARPLTTFTQLPAVSARPRIAPPAASIPRLVFKKSPFYSIQEALSVPTTLSDASKGRMSGQINLTLGETAFRRLKSDKSLRVMLYCALDSKSTSEQVICFPNMPDSKVDMLRVNGAEIKANLKGLKKKPGTTKPADITDYLHQVPNTTNTIFLVYAQSSQNFQMIVYLVRKFTAAELTEKLKTGNVISKERVLQEMAAKASDPDIEATSTIMSLKDPISMSRLTLPCRSTICSHNTCFDAGSFLEMQEQAPTWTCPTCNKTVNYQALVIDHYVLDILSKTSSSIDQVTIEPNGSWKEISADEDGSSRRKSQPRAHYDKDSDDDVVELDGPDGPEDSNLMLKPALKTETSISSGLTPAASREQSTTVDVATGSKRAREVVDLTLSDDDEEPQRPAKRINSSASATRAYHTPTSLPDIPQPRSAVTERPPVAFFMNQPQTQAPHSFGSVPPSFRPNFASSTNSTSSNNNRPMLLPNNSRHSTGSPYGNVTQGGWPSHYASFPSPWAQQPQHPPKST